MKIFDVIDGMSNVRRWGHAYCHKEEFVIDHTAIVALIALKIGHDLKADMGQLLQRALLHDMEEIITGDIPTPTKYANTSLTKEFHKYERESAKEVATAFGQWAFRTWENSKDATLEGDIIRLADAAAVAYKINQELRLGNNYFEKFIRNCWSALEKQRLNGRVSNSLKPYIAEFQQLLIGELNEHT